MVGAGVLVVYLAVIYGIYVPDWHFTVRDKDSIDYGKSFTVSPLLQMSYFHKINSYVLNMDVIL